MAIVRHHLPYQKKRLEEFAARFGCNSGYLWVASSFKTINGANYKAPALAYSSAPTVADTQAKP